MENIEAKASYQHISVAEGACRAKGCLEGGVARQVDTYFDVPDGRLKVRECSTSGNKLIFYSRSDKDSPRTSQFLVLPVFDNVEVLKDILKKVLPMRVVVRKHRHLYLCEKLQIHLDTVENLGTFVELEYPIENEDDRSQAAKTIEAAFTWLGIEPRDMIAVSYADLLVSRRGST